MALLILEGCNKVYKSLILVFMMLFMLSRVLFSFADEASSFKYSDVKYLNDAKGVKVITGDYLSAMSSAFNYFKSSGRMHYGESYYSILISECVDYFFIQINLPSIKSGTRVPESYHVEKRSGNVSIAPSGACSN
ncbi:hypothetical protein [Marinagarivorans algicola]